jgi:uncharacterized membrane protein HdeD (DUF308 family)
MAARWREQTVGAGIPGSGRLWRWSLGPPVTVPELGRVRRWLIVSGILALIAGAVAIAVPIIASITVALFIGWVLIFASIPMAVDAISDRVPVRALEALLTFIVGLYLLLFPLTGTVTLTFVLAVWFFASGVMSLIHAWQWRDSAYAWLSAFAGAMSVVLGFLIAASLPSSAGWAIGLLVGVNLIFWGTRALVAAQALKHVPQV